MTIQNGAHTHARDGGCWVGVDPGARTTGVVVVSAGGEVLRVVLVKNRGGLLPVPAEYVGEVCAVVGECVDEFGCGVRVEGVTRPSWHVAKSAKRGAASNPEALLGTCMVLGGVLAMFPDAEVVAPGGNGSGVNGVYPSCIVSDGERRGEGWQFRVGSGELRHARSAFDIANGGVRGSVRRPYRAGVSGRG